MKNRGAEKSPVFQRPANRRCPMATIILLIFGGRHSTFFGLGRLFYGLPKSVSHEQRKAL